MRDRGNIVAAGGTGKSFVMLATALGVGVGRDVGEIWGRKPTQGKVVFLSLEDVETELKRRLHVLKRKLSPTEQAAAAEAVDVHAAAGRGLATSTPGRGGLPVAKEWFKDFAAAIRNSRPRLLIIDTLNRFLGGLSENDGGHMAYVLNHVEKLAADSRCAIVLCHHASKAALASETANEAHAARGSSVLTDNARWQVNLSTPTKKGQYKDMPDVERRRHVLLEFAKLNYGEPQPSRLLVRGEGGSISGAPGTGTSARSVGTGRQARPAAKSFEDAFKLKDIRVV